jgi:hypothetical protein
MRGKREEGRGKREDPPLRRVVVEATDPARESDAC